MRVLKDYYYAPFKVYATVLFHNELGFQGAVKAGSVVASDGNVLTIKANETSEATRTYTAKGLPNDITVQQLYNYFRFIIICSKQF